MDLFGSSSFKALEIGLQGAQVRQNAISQNIANVDTPNYKAKTVSFKHLLNEEVNKGSFEATRTSDKHLQFSSGAKGPIIQSSQNTMYNHNQNNVDIDLEMAELAKNQIYYNALIDRINGRFNSLQTVIKG